MTNPAERTVREGYELLVPRTPEDFERVWRASADRMRLIQEIEDFQLKYSDEAVELARLQKARETEKMTGRYADGLVFHICGDTHMIRHLGVLLILFRFQGSLRFASFEGFRDCETI